jgi:CheY-like chemotaxis protein
MGRHNPDLLITDLSMPGMDGVKLLHRLVAMDKDIGKSVIVITALNPEEIAAKGGLPADVPIYPKPVSFPALRALVDFKLSKSKIA